MSIVKSVHQRVGEDYYRFELESADQSLRRGDMILVGGRVFRIRGVSRSGERFTATAPGDDPEAERMANAYHAGYTLAGRYPA